MELIFILHFFATIFMTGLIWFVQVVHYPLFHVVGPDEFMKYEAAHMRRTAWVVVPLMLIELLSGGILLWRPGNILPYELALAGFGLLMVIWVSTALLQAPKHRMLAGGYDGNRIRALVQTNWIRTATWTLRSVLLCLSLV